MFRHVLTNLTDKYMAQNYQNQPYHVWEGLVTEELSRLIDCTYSDASGILEAAASHLSHCWDNGWTPEQSASYMAEKTAIN